jgi:hypothetical protein
MAKKFNQAIKIKYKDCTDVRMASAIIDTVQESTDLTVEESVKEETPKTVEAPKKRGSKKAKAVVEKEATTEEITEVNE